MGARYADWGQRLAKAGFAVLLPDSNGSRGLGSQCGARQRSMRVDRERVADADAARAGCSSSRGSCADRVSLLGWSSGAIAALWAVRAPHGCDATAPDFRSAVAFYPGCRRLGRHRLERARADADPDRARRRPGVGRGLPADGGGRARPQRAGVNSRLSGRVPRLRPPQPAAAGRTGHGLLGRRQRPGA